MLTLERVLLKQIIQQCKNELPNEACGILAGKAGNVEKIYEMANIDKSPSTYFMDAKEQLRVMKDIRNRGLEMVGIYHSHVASQAYPSAHDLELAFYPEVSYVIVSFQDKINPSVKSFKIREGSISGEEIKIK